MLNNILGGLLRALKYLIMRSILNHYKQYYSGRLTGLIVLLQGSEVQTSKDTLHLNSKAGLGLPISANLGQSLYIL